MTEALDPVDASRCQAEVKEGSFMTLGPRPITRCKNKPVWLAIEVRDGAFYGSMSLCGECRKVCEIKMPSVEYQGLIA